MMRVSAEFRARVMEKWQRHAQKFWWGDRLDARFVAAAIARTLHGRQVLDIGCNAGIILSELEPDNVRIGVELAAEPLGIARALNPDAAFARGDMLRLPFRDASFDAVLFCGMLEVPSPARREDVLSEVARVLRPGGTLLMTTLNRRYLRYRRLDSRVTYEELERLLAPWFDARIRGFNPLPPFPYGLPNGVLARVPGIWGLLSWLMERDIALRSCCSFLVSAVRRPSELRVQAPLLEVSHV